MSFVYTQIESCSASWEVHHSSDVVLWALHLIRWHIISICPITGDVCFDYLIKMVSANFSTASFIYISVNSETTDL